MASIDKVGTGWRARWRTPDGASRSQTFARKVDAQRHLAGVEHGKLIGAYVDPLAGRVTFREYAEQWRAVQIHRPATAVKTEGLLRRAVYPHIGSIPIGAVRHSHLQAMVKALSERFVPHTVEVYMGTVSSVFKAAVADQVIARSPVAGLKLPAVERNKVVPMPLELLEALIDAMPERYRAVIVLGAGTGVRISEALGVTNDRVNWMRRSLLVDRQLTGTKGGMPFFGPVKDKLNRPRTIPLPDSVLTVLSDHVAKFGLGPEGVLFTNGAGHAFHRPGFADVWQPVARTLGIPPGEGFHQLRHFYASLLIRHGENVKVVQERLGHTTSKMTLDTYAHLWPEDEDRTRTAVDSVLGAVVSPACHGEQVGR